MEVSNFDLEYEAIMAELDDEVGVRSFSTKSWFEKNYEKLQNIIDRYKHNPALSKKRGDNAVTLIRRLASLDGIYMQNGEPLSSGYISQTMSEVRKRKARKLGTPPHPTSVRAAAKLEITGGRVRPGKASASASSSTVVEVATQSKAVNPDPIVEDIRVAQARYDKEKLSREKLYFLGEDRYILMEVFYPCYLEQRNRLRIPANVITHFGGS